MKCSVIFKQYAPAKFVNADGRETLLLCSRQALTVFRDNNHFIIRDYTSAGTMDNAILLSTVSTLRVPIDTYTKMRDFRT